MKKCFLLTIASLFYTIAFSADVEHVTHLNYQGEGSLYNAIDRVTSGGTILVNPSLAGQTILFNSMPVISKNCTIKGNGIILRLGEPLQIGSVTVTMERIHFDGFYKLAISNFGNLVLKSCIFSNNMKGEDGGAIYNTGTLSVLGCTFFNNAASRAGGAICSSGAKAITNLTGNVFYGNLASYGDTFCNYGGGVYSTALNVFDNSSLDSKTSIREGRKFDFSGTGDLPSKGFIVLSDDFQLLEGSDAIGVLKNIPSDYPVEDFYGAPMTDTPLSAGAVQGIYSCADRGLKVSSNLAINGGIIKESRNAGNHTVIPYGVVQIGQNISYEIKSIHNMSLRIVDNEKFTDNYAFMGKKALQTIDMPCTLTSIADFAFFNSGISSITLPSDRLKYIHDFAFAACRNLTTLSIPHSVESIGAGAFAYCTNLESIDMLSNTVTHISRFLFAYCQQLKSFDFPSSILSIESGAFASCTGLTSVDLPQNLTTLGQGVFSECNSLTSVIIPGSVTAIGETAFEKCTNLHTVTVFWTNPLAVKENVFMDVPLNNCVLKVPNGTEALYRNSPVWKSFGQIVEF